jgi:hypothetical protein
MDKVQKPSNSEYTCIYIYVCVCKYIKRSQKLDVDTINRFLVLYILEEESVKVSSGTWKTVRFLSFFLITALILIKTLNLQFTIL